ncbi:TonB-dependent receptor [Sphingopyxis sp. DBS4]|uniref:TonB-dependent receptor n=1 Tax=Sphingopyxis sp. DBS4 TaxID=2968500 RepID=UPI00214CCE22|nr:TonB-dependent receptor [Sphingopyxis sp. DBS4]
MGLMNHRTYLRAHLAAVALIAPWMASAAHAQETAPAAGETASGGLDEIIVTAQKRSESLQDTPLAISAINAEAIEQRGITNVAALGSAAPNLIITETPSATANPSISIRGIVDNDPILTADPAVGLYVDGVIVGRSAGALFDMMDLERVEVLRGPQGTLYGRNTTGGAVNLISAKPSKEFGGKLQVGYGKFDEYMVKALLDTGELGDTGLALKLGYYHSQRDGTVDNLLEPSDKRDPGARNTDAVRAAVRFDKGTGFTVDYVFDSSDRNGRANAFQLRAVRQDILDYLNASSALGGAVPQVSQDRLSQVRLDNDGNAHDRVQGHALTINWEIGDATLRSITGYRKWDNVSDSSDLDGNGGLVGFLVSPAVLAPPYPFIPEGVGPIDLFHTSNERHQKQFSQEFNLIGSIGDEFDYVLGAYYFRERATEDNPQGFTLVLPSPVPIPIAPGVDLNSFGVNLDTLLSYRHISRSMAAFTQLTWKPAALDSRLSITGGLRYTEDKKHLIQSAPVPPAPRDLTRKFNRLNWLANISYNWSDDIMTYVRASTGYKAGGFNARAADNNGFDPEDLTSYEIGFKSELFDRRLRFNVAAFRATYDDLQVQQFLAGTGGASSTTVNAAKATYTGIEAELQARLFDGFTVDGSIGYTDRKYKKFLFVDPLTGVTSDISKIAKFQYSAATTANIGAQYETALGSFGNFTARADWSYRSKIYWHPVNPFNDAIADGGVGLLNARLSISDIDVGGAKASIAVWGRNLTKEDYMLSGIDFGSLGFAGVMYGDPRSYGIEVGFKF